MCDYWEVAQYVQKVTVQYTLQKELISVRTFHCLLRSTAIANMDQARRSEDGSPGTWIEVVKDDWRAKRAFWRFSQDPEDKRMLALLDTLQGK